MLEMAVAPPAGAQSERWRQFLLPLLLLVVALGALAWPVTQLWPLARYAIIQPLLPRPEAFEPQPLGASEYFRVEGPAGYMTDADVNAFLETLETRRQRLAAYLDVCHDCPPVTIRLFPYDGMPTTHNPELIDVYALSAGRSGIVHALTHTLVGCRNCFLAEGLAVLTEEKFGWNAAYPAWTRPVDGYLFAELRREGELLPLRVLAKRSDLQDPSRPEESQLPLLQAGSFVRYLVETYGIDPLLAVYNEGTYANVYGLTLRQLEAGWLNRLQVEHLALAFAVTLGGLAVLGLTHVAVVQGRWWWAPAGAGWLAFLVWSYYLVYAPWLPLALLAALVAGAFLSRENRVRGLALLWLSGSGVLLLSVLWPPLAPYFT